MEKEQTLQQRIKSGKIRREDVARRLAELAFGKVNDCVRLVLEDDPAVEKLDLGSCARSNGTRRGRWRSSWWTGCGRWSSCVSWQNRRGRMWNPS